MNSTANPEAGEPNEALAARADERLAHAYEQIARADEQLARVTGQLSRLERDAARPASTAAGQRPSRSGPVLRGLTGLLLAACIVGAAFLSQSSYGDAVKPVVARWMPQLVLASSLPLQKPGLATQSGPSGIQLAAADPSSAQATPQDGAPAAAPAAPDVGQLLQTMARDLANLEQGIEQIKARQEQLASDNAKAIEDLKASQGQMAGELQVSQDQMARLIANVSDSSGRPRASAPKGSAALAQPIPPLSRRPQPTHPLPEARAQP